ncbi:MAG: hypothetical protein IPO91_28905 [Chloroflexi bacterium]|nr:hypothetical protein [Chloroflexota bacterium]
MLRIRVFMLFAVILIWGSVHAQQLSCEASNPGLSLRVATSGGGNDRIPITVCLENGTPDSHEVELSISITNGGNLVDASNTFEVVMGNSAHYIGTVGSNSIFTGEVEWQLAEANGVYIVEARLIVDQIPRPDLTARHEVSIGTTRLSNTAQCDNEALRARFDDWEPLLNTNLEILLSNISGIDQRYDLEFVGFRGLMLVNSPNQVMRSHLILRAGESRLLRFPARLRRDATNDLPFGRYGIGIRAIPSEGAITSCLAYVTYGPHRIPANPTRGLDLGDTNAYFYPRVAETLSKSRSNDSYIEVWLENVESAFRQREFTIIVSPVQQNLFVLGEYDASLQLGPGEAIYMHVPFEITANAPTTQQQFDLTVYEPSSNIRVQQSIRFTIGA